MKQDPAYCETESTSFLDVQSPIWALFENSSHGLLVTSPDGRIFAANNGACKILGWNDYEFCLHGLSLVVDSALMKQFTEPDTGRLLWSCEGEFMFRHKNGLPVPVHVSSRLFSHRTGKEIAILIFRDSQEPQVPTPLSAQQPICPNGFSEAVIPGIALLLPDTKIRPLNRTFMAMLGYDSSGSQSLELATLFGSEDDHQKFLNLVQLSGSPGDVLETEVTFRHKNGRDLRATLILYPVDSSTRNCSYVMVLEDVSLSVQSGINPLHGQRLWETFMEKSPVAVSLQDDSGKFVFVNNRWLESFSPDQVTWKGMTAMEIFPPDAAYLMRQTDLLCLEEGKTLEYNVSFSDCLGVQNTWRITKFRYLGPDERAYVFSMALNINDRVKAETSYQHLKQRYDDLLGGLKRVQTRMKPVFEESEHEISGKTILVVEDNDLVRSLQQQALTEAKYNTIAASDGKEALNIFKERHAQIDLVVLDVMLPEMNGRDCLMELKRINPEVKVIILTGSDSNAELNLEIKPHVREFLTKPFRMSRLLEAVEQVIYV